MRTTLTTLLSIVAILMSLPAYSVIVPDPPEISAKGFILMDFQSGKIIASSQPETPLAPASLTKVMTAYIVGLEINAGRLSWDDIVTVSVNAWSMKFPDSSKMFIQPKDEIAILDLMKGIIVQSGNDACVAVAEHIAGSEEAFVGLMNEVAKSIGMNNTHYINAHGLDGESIQTSAQDMAILMQRLIQDTPDVYKLYNIKNFTWTKITQYNRNKLLWDKSLKVDGGKTGYTEGAGYSLTASAKEGRMRLISVVLGTKSKRLRIEETRKLLTYGFRFFDTKNVAKQNRVEANEVVWMGSDAAVDLGVTKDVFLTLPQDQIEQTKKIIELDGPLKAPLIKGEVVGSVHWFFNEELIHSEPLVTKKAVAQGSWFSRTLDSVQLFFKSIITKFSN